MAAARSDRSTRLVAFSLRISLLLSLALALVAMLVGQLSLGAAGAFVVGVAVVWLLFLSLVRRGKPVIAFLAVAVLNLLLVVPELGLRAAGFRAFSWIAGGYPSPEDFVKLVPDPELFWRYAARDGVNRHGFPGPELEFEKSADVARVVFIGDSCTIPTSLKTELDSGYPRVCGDLLNERKVTSRRVESVTLAVAGYSSHQGRILAREYGVKLKPDAVVVYYGWNDHWRAYGSIDSEKTVAVGMSRLLEFLGWVAAKMSDPQANALDSPRVPADDYRNNLTDIVRMFRDRGVPVVLVTAPTSHRVVGVPDYLIEENFVDDKETAVRIHTEYTDIVREIARAAKDPNVVVLDLEREANKLTAKRLRELFGDDGIHFHQPGIDWAADRLATEVAKLLK